MAFIPISEAAKAAIAFSMTGQRVLITLTFRLAVAYDLTTLADLALKLHTWYTTYLKGNLSGAIALTDIVCTAIHSITAPQHTRIISPGEAGTAGASSLGLGEAMVVTLRTALRGRNYRGRTYLPGVGGLYRVDPGSISTTGTSQILAAMAKLIDVPTMGTHVLVVPSRFTGGLPRVNGVANAVTAISMDNFLDSQRRRLVGRGN